MTHDEIREHVKKILARLAPDFDLAALDPRESLRHALAVDSMDILNFATALYEKLGVDIPERDYKKIDTLDDCVDYLAAVGCVREKTDCPRRR